MTEIVSEPQAPQATPQNNPQDQQAASRSRRGGQGRQPNQAGQQAARPQNPLLEQLAQWHPALFGEQLVPFKRGIFEDLLAAHPEALERESLKAALALHARSSRYPTVVSSQETN